MDAYKIIKDDLISFIRTWLKTGLICNTQVSGEFFSNPTEIKSDVSYYKSETNYDEMFLEDYEKQRFLLALEDGSFFQVAFEFIKIKKNTFLKKATLSFLPNNLNEGEWHSYLRMDYDLEGDNSFFHPVTHLHIGLHDDIRIPTDEIPLFSEFFKFVMYLYYKEKFFQIYKLDSISNTEIKDCGRLTSIMPISHEAKQFVYLNISQIANSRF